MDIFKKLFGKKKSKQEKVTEPECWYNNYHEKKKKSSVLPSVEGGALAGPNQAEYSNAQWLSNHQ